MGLLRVLLCLLLPPAAVLDKGCGSILLVGILTLFGWVPGAIAALMISLKETPADQPLDNSMFAVPKLSHGQWSKTLARIPVRGPYEEAATDRQRDRLWRMGFRDEGALDGLGKAQASALISMGDGVSRQSSGVIGAVGVVLLIMLGIGAILSLVGRRETETRQVLRTPAAPASRPLPPEPTPAPVSTPVPPLELRAGGTARTVRDTQFIFDDGVGRIPAGTVVPVTAVKEKEAVIEYQGRTGTVLLLQLLPES